HGISQIDVKRLVIVSNAHRAATQLYLFSVFTRHEFVMLKSVRRVLQRRLNRFLESRLAGLNSAGKSLAKHADRTEFHCSRKYVTATRAGALGLHAHGIPTVGVLRRPSRNRAILNEQLQNIDSQARRKPAWLIRR